MVLSNFLELCSKLKNMYFFVKQILFSIFLCDTMYPDYLPLIVKVYNIIWVTLLLKKACE